MQLGGGSARGVGLLGAGILAAWWSATAAPSFFPDGYELAAAGACLWGLPPDPSLPCGALDLGYTTPLFPLLAGPLGLWLGRLGGVVALALASMALCWIPLSALARRLGGARAVLATGLLLASSPELRAWALVPDERPLALLLVASACAIAAGAQGLTAAALAGALAGLSGWARPEALAAAVLIPTGLLLRDRRQALAAGLSAGALVAGWLVMQRVLGGTWLPRPYEVAALELLVLLPDDWAKRLVGMGAWSPPVRAWGLINGVPAPSGGFSPDPLAGVAWIGRALAVGSHPAHWLLAGVGIASALWRPPQRRALIALLGIMAPWLIASALLHARLDALPMANLLVVLLVLSVLAGAGAGRLGGWAAAWLPARAGPAVGLVVASSLAVGAGRHWPLSPVRPGVELSAPGTAASAWLADHSGVVCSTYESAPIVFRAGRPWQEWPTPFEPERWADVDWVVRTHLDVSEPVTLAPGTHALEEVAGWAADGRWVRIYSLSSE
ncbi:MAG: hypothetical protein ACI8S6_003217 [Myxococcota bacterium]|jgi:hypothetical protein